MDNTSSNSSIKLDVAYWEQIIVSVPIALIAITGIIGNSLIIVAVSFSRKLQTSTNAFVTSLAIADLLTSFSLIFYLIGALGRNGWPIPQAEWLCVSTAFMTYACRGTSLYTLGTIAVNRLLLITRPSLYKDIFVSWKLVILLTIPWILPWGSIIILLLIGFGAFGYDDTDLACAIVDSDENAVILSVTTTLIAFPIPLFVTIVSYTWIYIHLKKYFRAKKQKLAVVPRASAASANTVAVNLAHLNSKVSSSDQPNPTNEESEPKVAVTNSDQRERISRKQIEITKNLFMVVCSLVLCFLPYFILIFVPNSNYILFYTRVITLANSAINFAIYALKHPDFRVVFGCMCRCSYTEIPRPSRLLKFLLSKKS